MRAARAIPVVLAFALAPGGASAEPPPRVAVRLDYTRGKGGAACPADPTALRAEVEHVMGYDPFEPSAPERLAVVMSSQGGAFAALVERFNAAGVTTWSETFSQNKPTPGNCAALFPPLASYLDGLFLSYQGVPAARPEPAARAPSLPAALPELRVLPAQPANPPDPPNAPNLARATAKIVAIVAYAVGGTFLGLGIGWSVYGKNKADAAQALATESHPSAGNSACHTSSISRSYCRDLLAAWQSSDNAGTLRNSWFASAGASVALGTVATVWTLNLPTTIGGQPQTQVRLRPGGLALSGSF